MSRGGRLLSVLRLPREAMAKCVGPPSNPLPSARDVPYRAPRRTGTHCRDWLEDSKGACIVVAAAVLRLMDGRSFRASRGWECGAVSLRPNGRSQTPCRPRTDPTIAQTPCCLGILPTLFWVRVRVIAKLGLLGVIVLSNNPYVAGSRRSRIAAYERRYFGEQSRAGFRKLRVSCLYRRIRVRRRLFRRAFEVSHLSSPSDVKVLTQNCFPREFYVLK